MFIEVDREQHRLLVGLVESRISELHPEIRRCRDYRFSEGLKHDLEVMQELLHKLHEAECDVQA
jgi:hypothetical protein